MDKIIGIDVDGVLTDEGTEQNNIWTDYLIKFLGKKIKLQEKTYDFSQAYGLPEETIYNYLEQYEGTIYQKVKPFAGAKQTLQRLADLNFKLYLITARDNKFRKITEKWLQNNGFTYTELFHEKDKAPLARDKKVSLFIEDNQQNAERLISADIPVILVNKYHNQKLKPGSLLYRANNWQEITEHINHIFKLDLAEEGTA